MQILPGNAQHIGARHSQQDSFGFSDPDDQDFLAHGGFLAVVCDGMGGMEQGDAASRTAVRAVLEAYRRKLPEESIAAALERSVREANQRVVDLARSLGLLENIGTTLVAAVVTDDSFYYASVGDSALFLVTGGHISMINRPHVFANLLDQAVARGVITQADAERHPERESLTSYIGAESLEEIDHNLGPLPLNQGDTILLATDGLFKTLAHEEMRACLQGSPQDWPEILVAETIARQREYQDNVTVLSIAMETAAAPAPPLLTPDTDFAAPPPPEFPSRSQDAIPARAPWDPPVQSSTAEPSITAAPPAIPRRNAAGGVLGWRGLVLGSIAMILVFAAGGWWYLANRSVHGRASAVIEGSGRALSPAEQRAPVQIEPDPRARQPQPSQPQPSQPRPSQP